MRLRACTFVTLALASGCNRSSLGQPDGGAHDSSTPVDLAAPSDLGSRADLAPPPDLAAPPDLVAPPDLLESPDLAELPGNGNGDVNCGVGIQCIAPTNVC